MTMPIERAVEPHPSDFTFAPLTPAAFLTRAAQAFAHRTAIVDGDLTFTYADYHRRALALTGVLEDLGIGESLPASLVLPNGDYPGVVSVVDPEGVVWGQYLPPFDVKLLTARYLKTRVGR